MSNIYYWEKLTPSKLVGTVNFLERETERDRERQRETERDREKQRETERQTETNRERDRETETETETKRQREDIERHRET